MKALLIPVGGLPREIDVNGLEDLQHAVGGHIEACSWVFDDAPAVYVNEEGLYTCMPNRAVYATAECEGKSTWSGEVIHEGDLLSILFGDIVAIGFDSETGEDRDISDEEVRIVNDRFGTDASIDSGLIEVFRMKAGLSRPVF